MLAYDLVSVKKFRVEFPKPTNGAHDPWGEVGPEKCGEMVTEPTDEVGEEGAGEDVERGDGPGDDTDEGLEESKKGSFNRVQGKLQVKSLHQQLEKKEGE